MTLISHDLADRLSRIDAPAAVADLAADDLAALEEALVAAGYLSSDMSHEAAGVAEAVARLATDYALGGDDTVTAAVLGQLMSFASTADTVDNAPAVSLQDMGGTIDVSEVPSADKSDDELAVAIIEHEYEILDQWDKAVEIFEKVMTSNTDAEAKPDFVNALTEHFEEKVLGRLAEEVTYGGEALEVLTVLGAEVERARSARESADLRQFFVEHKQAVADLQKQLTTIKDDFRAKVRLTEQAMWSGDQAKVDEYGMMRLALVEYFDDVDRRLRVASTEAFFQLLSEEWLQGSTVSDEYGTGAYIAIHLEEDFTIRQAEIKGTGADKLAEQLLRDSRDDGGVDVFGMSLPRRVLCYRRGESYPYAIVKLDASNNLTNDGSFAEGNYMPIYEWLMQNGLPRTTNLN
jgi:hypothetical protein